MKLTPEEHEMLATTRASQWPFVDLPQAEYERLRADLERRGLIEPFTQPAYKLTPAGRAELKKADAELERKAGV